jgi:hypothetical protein
MDTKPERTRQALGLLIEEPWRSDRDISRTVHFLSIALRCTKLGATVLRITRDVKSQLRITTWPAIPLPLPNVELRTWGLDAEEGVLVPQLGDQSAPANAGWLIPAPPDLIEPSGETYLRLAEVDLEDADAILEFVNRHGVLGGGRAFASLRHYIDSDLFWKHYEHQLDSEHESDKTRRALEAELLRSGHPLAQLRRDGDDAVWDNALGSALGRIPPAIETLEEFRFAARCIRDLYSAWLMFKDNREVHEFNWTSPTWPDLFDSFAEPAALLSYMLKVFLRDFAPQVRMSWKYSGPAQADDVFRPADAMAVEPTPGPETAALYAVCALELFNHIIDSAEYHECANERCKRTFVHQQGRSEKGQRRSRGVIYCSPECARATAQREYRRRRRRRDQ